MTCKRSWMTLLASLPLLLLFGCSEYGKVDQGRVIAFDQAKRLVTIIRDKANDAQTPDYTGLPPALYTLPTDPQETGPEPKPGGRMKLDTKKNQITIFDTKAQNFKTIDYTLVDLQENIDRDHPLVFDKEQEKAKKFPAVDKAKKTIAIYSARQKMLVTFSLPDEYLELPEATWDAGDEVRFYYKEEGKALRFMNISKTNIFKK